MRALVTCLSDPSRGPRPKRMVDHCLARGYTVEVLSPEPKTRTPGVHYHPYAFSLFGFRNDFVRILGKLSATALQKIFPDVATKGKIMGWGHGFQKLHEVLAAGNYDLIIVEDLDMVPLVFSLKKSACILLDAREYYPRQREDSVLFNFFQAPYRHLFCETWLKKCDAVLTVSPGLANEYRRVYGIDPILMRSVPNAREISVSNCGTDTIRLVHHGLANRNRQLPQMLDVFKRLDARFQFDLYLTGSRTVINQIKKQAREIPRLNIRQPVPLDQIIPTLSHYDIGFYFLQPNGFNLKHSLPNKLFEFIQARLAVAIGPSPDMADIVHHYKCGFVAPSFSIESMAETLSALNSDQINAAKEMSHKAARDLCFEEENKKLDQLLDGLLDQ